MDVPLEPPAAPSPEELALEYLEKHAEGPSPEIGPWLARLEGEDARRKFREFIEDAQRVQRALPQVPRAIVPKQLIAGRYLLSRQLGVGGMGQVWEARDQQLDRNVAVKFLDSASRGRIDREEMFQKESRLLASLQHPGIVAVHEFGRDGDLTYIVMDLVHGRSLSEVIDEVRGKFLARGEQPLPRDSQLLEEALHQPRAPGRPDLCEGGDWFRCVARIELDLVRTIEAAHGQKVIHRDLKPSNVMLTAGANPVVLDFGLAGSSEGVKGAVTQGLYGSVAYLAPEQARSQTVGNDPRTDVYQLGLVLYELLTLQRTFPGNAIGDVLERIQHGRFPTPRKVHKLVPPELEAICLHAIELDPARRYPSARELREDLERWLGGHELPRAVRAGKLRRGMRRVRWQVRQRPWVSAAAGLVLAGGAGILFHNRDLALDDVRPLRYDSQTKQAVFLDQGEPVVHKDDYLGFSFHSNKAVHVWALSVYGPQGAPDRVTPYRAVIPDELTREGEYGLRLRAGENIVLGPQMDANPNPSEGLMLFVSDEEEPFMEDWFGKMNAGQGDSGMAWAQAKELGIQSVSVTRGVDRHTRALTPEEREAIRAAFRKASETQGQIRMDLPGVQTLQVQCASR
jgi:hypothetical protein